MKDSRGTVGGKAQSGNAGREGIAEGPGEVSHNQRS